MVAIGGLGIVAATTAFAAGARYFKASIKPTNSIVAGVVVSFAAYFLMLPLHLIFYSARHAGWTTLGTVVTVSFFAPLLFGDDKQSEK
jgi:multidrug transporter EmrE-like cation transporter